MTTLVRKPRTLAEWEAWERQRRTGIPSRRKPDARNTTAWTQLAKRVIAEEPTCRIRGSGCTIKSTTADHIISVRERPDLALQRANCRGACAHCNFARGARATNKARRGRRSVTRVAVDPGRHIKASNRKQAPALAWFDG